MKTRINLLILLVIIVLSFFWKKTELNNFTVPMLGMLSLTYMVIAIRTRHKKLSHSISNMTTAFLITTAGMILVIATGGINSALFFLLYFLNFILAFMLNPQTAIIFSSLTFLLFLPDSFAGNVFENIAKLASILLLCPLAFFFAKEINKRETNEEKQALVVNKTNQYAEQIIEDVAELIKTENKELREEEISKLQDIVNQSKNLEKTINEK